MSTYLVGGGPALLQHSKTLLKSKADNEGERNSHLAILLRGDEAIDGIRAEQVKLDIEVHLLLICRMFIAKFVPRLPGHLYKPSISHPANSLPCRRASP